MPESTGKTADGHALDLRLSVPAEGDLREIAGELAAKVAEHLGAAAGDAQSLAAKVARLALQLRNGSPQAQDIVMEFRQVEGELVVRSALRRRSLGSAPGDTRPAPLMRSASRIWPPTALTATFNPAIHRCASTTR